MQTNGFEAGAKRVNSIRSQMAKDYEKHAKTQTNAEKSIASTIESRKKAEEKLAAAQKKTNNEAEIKRIVKQIDVLRNKEGELRAAYKARNVEFLKLNKEQSEALKEQIKLTDRAKMRQDLLAGATKGLAGGAAILTAAFAFTKKIAGDLDAIAKRARDIGISATGLFEFQHQAKLAGASTGELDVALKTFVKNSAAAQTGTNAQSKAFDMLGISMKSANGTAKTTKELMIEVAEASKNGMLDAKTASDLFGESGLKMIRIFEGGADAIKSAFESNYIDEAARAAESFNDSLENLSHTAMPYVYKAAGELAEAFDQLFRWEGFETKYERKTAEVVARMEAEKKALEDRIPILKRVREAEEELNHAREWSVRMAGTESEAIYAAEATAAETRLKELAPKFEAYRKPIAEKIAKTNAELLKFTTAQLDNQTQLDILTAQMLKDKETLKLLDKDSLGYAEAYDALAKKKIEYLKLEKAVSDDRKKALAEEAMAAKRAAEESAREQAAAKKEAEAEAKREAEKAQRQSDGRKEFELQLKIQQLEKRGYTEMADAIKNSLERNRLMKEYGYSIEEATKKLQEQKDATKGEEKIQYSKKDIERAQKMVDRGAGGSVGKKTLEQAQAILDGKKIEGDELAAFGGASKRAKKPSKKLKFAPDSVVAPEASTMPSNSLAASNAELKTTAKNTQPQPKTEAKQGDGLAETLKQILDAVKLIPGTIKEVFAN